MKAKIYRQFPKLLTGANNQDTYYLLCIAAQIVQESIREEIHPSLYEKIGHRVDAALEANG